jgi:hypothetical protein
MLKAHQTSVLIYIDCTNEDQTNNFFTISSISKIYNVIFRFPEKKEMKKKRITNLSLAAFVCLLLKKSPGQIFIGKNCKT